jgi:nucleotidyltransferase/DNA polymerase involved in DNA repair
VNAGHYETQQENQDLYRIALQWSQYRHFRWDKTRNMYKALVKTLKSSSRNAEQQTAK